MYLSLSHTLFLSCSVSHAPSLVLHRRTRTETGRVRADPLRIQIQDAGARPRTHTRMHLVSRGRRIRARRGGGGESKRMRRDANAAGLGLGPRRMADPEMGMGGWCVAAGDCSCGGLRGIVRTPSERKRPNEAEMRVSFPFPRVSALRATSPDKLESVLLA
jgi:hypothetical protein